MIAKMGVPDVRICPSSAAVAAVFTRKGQKSQKRFIEWRSRPS